MSKPTIDWNGIRPINGSRAAGFEELCSQLGRTEVPPGSHFFRKGTPDGGVESYAILSSGTEWGWQAKYFDVLGESQWSQLDKSVKTALEKHPRLTRYFVCVPLDRPDARIERQRSAKDRWNDHVTKWAGWAAKQDMSVEFVYWGSHELLERLSRPEHVGRVRFWFDVHRFDQTWFKARLDEALKTAGPRYTPEIHVDLPIAADLDVFGRTDRFFTEIKSYARKVREKLRNFAYADAGTSDPSLDKAGSTLSSQVQIVLAELGAVEIQPTGALPFSRIAGYVAAAEATAGDVERLLSEREDEYDTQVNSARRGSGRSPHDVNPFRQRRGRLRYLILELQRTREVLSHAEAVAGQALMLLRGDAGTGKTHLLCDVARHRIAENRPTVLLMGQRFVSADAPWTQALQQLDLSGVSAEEFTGAIEAAAQAANSRALVLIDAVNEGSGRIIWPSHLAAFLAHLERSPWVGVVLSVRASYEELVIPDEVRARAVVLTHNGFADHEYDATRMFFVHYGLELPSTPLLAPEFRNPLFLKTLCRGLQAQGYRRLPRGFHGITAAFDLYLSAINERLAYSLGYNPKTSLVRKALEAFSRAVTDRGQRWLALSEAEELVNGLLPGREFERSLYRGLVIEGMLVEEAIWRDAGREEVTFIAYERLADHLVAKTLLDQHLDPADSVSAFALGQPLAFLSDETISVAPGLLEAMCIQVPERTGQEFIFLAPIVQKRWGIGDAFRQSLVWRAPTAFSHDTRKALSVVLRTDGDLDDTIDVILTVATIPGHPLNATFLDERLRRDAMADRDSWWSTYLHRAWGSRGAVDRLVDWASSVDLNTPIEDESVDLCAISLAWMLTASNRFLRDRATKALVSLLTGRMSSVVRLVDRFADVDDPYVLERVYAVAYGTAMRSHHPVQVRELAACVYGHVFANGAPPVHILLRDYARGVVERALHLGCQLHVDVERIRPPYGTPWPHIPAEEEIKHLLPDWSRGSHDSGDVEWARNRIGSSVMSDDFAFYVIGTNGSPDWLSVRLDEPVWKSPTELLTDFVEDLSDNERQAWERFHLADEALEQSLHVSLLADLLGRFEEDAPTSGSDSDAIEAPSRRPKHRTHPNVSALERGREQALLALEGALSEEHRHRFSELLAMKEATGDRPPHLDLRQLQRYILWRVFDLGWTTERFGQFDRFSVQMHGREAAKAERIGKKYQWIAYHEITAMVADNFRYKGHIGDGEVQVYHGPWQMGLRDIDPSCTLSATLGGTSWDGHAIAWWGSERYELWGDPGDRRAWVVRWDDLPAVDKLFSVSNPDNTSKWLNVDGYFNWKQPSPPDQDSRDVERREVWYIFTGYLIRAEDAEVFMDWAEGVDFWGRWMPEAPEAHRMFLGEYAWAPASRFEQQEDLVDDNGWTKPEHGCPVKVCPIAVEYHGGASSFDCSGESFTLRLPATQLVSDLQLRWTGSGGDYMDDTGRLAVQDPTSQADGPSALLLRDDKVREFLVRNNLTICWAVLGEKRVLGAGPNPEDHASMRMSGAYLLRDSGPVGFLKCILDDHATDHHERAGVPISIIWTPRPEGNGY